MFWFGIFLKVATSAVYSEFKIIISSHQTSMWLNIYHITVNNNTLHILIVFLLEEQLLKIHII